MSTVKTKKTKNNPKKTENRGSKDTKCPSLLSGSGSSIEGSTAQRKDDLSSDFDQSASEHSLDDHLRSIPEHRRPSLSRSTGNIGKMKNQRPRRRASKVNYNEDEDESTEESKDDERKRENDSRSVDEFESNGSESDSEIKRKYKKKKTDRFNDNICKIFLLFSEFVLF